MIIFNDTLDNWGGTMTLLYRMCMWYRENNEEVCVLCESYGNEEIREKIEKMGVKTSCVGFFDLEMRKNAIESFLKEGKQIKVINFNLNHYMDIEYLRFKNKYDIRNVMYVIHPDCLKKGNNIKVHFIKKSYMRYFYSFINRMNDNNAIFFMDNDTIDATKDYFCDDDMGPFKFIPIPIDIMPNEKWEKNVERRFTSKTILTAARADFPFKGYLLGLIDVFVGLKEMIPDVILRIYADGNNIDRLKRKINSLEEKYSNSIELMGWIDYEGLVNEMEKCKVYIGMGASLLDASKMYTPSIAIKHSTEKCVADSFFFEQPYIVCEEYKENMLDKSRILLREIFDLSYNQYMQISLKSFDEVNNIYNPDVVMPSINRELDNNIKTSMNYSRMILHGLYQSINKIRFRKEI